MIFDEKRQRRSGKITTFVLTICCVLSFVYSWFFVGVIPAKIAFSIAGEGFWANMLNATLKILFLSIFVLFLRVFSQFNEMLRFNAAIEKDLKKDKKSIFAPNFLHSQLGNSRFPL